ncbi:MAG TPA: aspartate aminotransferase family protein [Acidimicrobiales bacterium]|nr:aspartate aminotransferase family protein [Acidimicrobiales bacterium]
MVIADLPEAPDPAADGTLAWANPDPSGVPCLVTASPGPLSRDWHRRMERHTGGSVTRMVKLHPVAYRSGRGVTLTDVDGNTYLDFSSGIVVTNIGHAHPKVAEAIASAAARLDNIHDFASPEKVEALEALATVTPPGLDLFTFFSSGTEAVEAAMRVARAVTGRAGFVSFHNDYHGRTGGAASVTSSRSSNGARDPGSYLVPSGHCYRCSFGLTHPGCGLRCARFVEESVQQNLPGQLAGAVMELVTNGNGATVYQPGYVSATADAVRRSGGVFIADEIATGFGRTGAWFACDDEGVVPDVMAIGKGMGNGFPVTAIAVRREFAEALEASFPSTSYGGNPMACAAVAAVVRVMREEDLVGHARQVGELALDRLRRMAARHPLIGEVRGRGMLLAVELVKDPVTREPFVEAGNFVYQEAFRHGLAWASAGHILRITPPIVISVELMTRGLDIIEEAIGAAERRFGYG